MQIMVDKWRKAVTVPSLILYLRQSFKNEFK